MGRVCPCPQTILKTNKKGIRACAVPHLNPRQFGGFRVIYTYILVSSCYFFAQNCTSTDLRRNAALKKYAFFLLVYGIIGIASRNIYCVDINLHAEETVEYIRNAEEKVCTRCCMQLRDMCCGELLGETMRGRLRSSCRAWR